MFLTKDEVIELTGKKQRLAQAKVLDALGITHKVRPDGSLVVLRSHVEQQLGGIPKPREREEEKQSREEVAWRVQFEARLEAMRAEEEEEARKREAQRAAKKERVSRDRKRRWLPPIE